MAAGPWSTAPISTGRISTPTRPRSSTADPSGAFGAQQPARRALTAAAHAHLARATGRRAGHVGRAHHPGPRTELSCGDDRLVAVTASDKGPCERLPGRDDEQVTGRRHATADDDAVRVEGCREP